MKVSLQGARTLTLVVYVIHPAMKFVALCTLNNNSTRTKVIMMKQLSYGVMLCCGLIDFLLSIANQSAVLSKPL